MQPRVDGDTPPGLFALSPGTRVMSWPRALHALHPDEGPRVIDVGLREEAEALALATTPQPISDALRQQLGSCCMQVHDDLCHPGADSWSVQRLTAEDQACDGSVPGLRVAHARLMQAATAMQARRRLHLPPRCAWPTLPGSVVRRALTVWALGPGSVAVLDDIDGLGVLLAERCAVWSLPPHRQYGAWQTSEAQRSGVVHGWHLAANEPLPDGSWPQPPQVDAAVVSAGKPTQCWQQLEQACSITRPGGHIVLSVQDPWQSWLADYLRQRGLEIERTWRDVDWPVLPTLTAVDLPSELLVVRCPEDAQRQLPPASPTPPDADVDLRAAPNRWLEFCDLEPEAVRSADAVGKLLDCLATYSPWQEGARSVARAADSAVTFHWVDTAGTCLSGRLQTRSGDLLVQMAPAEPDLDHALTLAVMLTLGKATTRRRPVRSGRHMRRIDLDRAL